MARVCALSSSAGTAPGVCIETDLLYNPAQPSHNVRINALRYFVQFLAILRNVSPVTALSSDTLVPARICSHIGLYLYRQMRSAMRGILQEPSCLANLRTPPPARRKQRRCACTSRGYRVTSDGAAPPLRVLAALTTRHHGSWKVTAMRFDCFAKAARAPTS